MSIAEHFATQLYRADRAVALLHSIGDFHRRLALERLNEFRAVARAVFGMHLVEHHRVGFFVRGRNFSVVNLSKVAAEMHGVANHVPLPDPHTRTAGDLLQSLEKRGFAVLRGCGVKVSRRGADSRNPGPGAVCKLSEPRNSL